MANDFYINRRFLVEPGTHTVTDQRDGNATRLEARILQLLLIFSRNAGKSLTREELVAEIWQDYGGGDEGLTQSISVLRKVLLDSNKSVIKTVPKKGYIFTGEVSGAMGEGIVPAVRQEPKKTGAIYKMKWWIAGAAGVALIVCFFLVFNKKENAVPAATPTSVPYPENMAKEELLEENELNTIVTQGADSTRYKLVMIGDRPPKFFVNNVQLPEDKWEPYMSLINSLKRQLAEKRSD